MDEKTNKTKHIVHEIIEWVVCIIIAFILYLIVNYFLGTVSGVKQVSMKPTAIEGDKLLIQRPVIFKKEIKYGDIVTFESPTSSSKFEAQDMTTGKFDLNTFVGDDAKATFVELDGFTSFMYNFIGIGKISYIKRVIGIENDHILVADDGFVYRNGVRLQESYLKDNTTDQDGDYLDVIVPKGCVYLMGDNRLESKDSRYFGCIPIEKIDGYVLTRIWPIDRLGSLN